MKAISSLSQDYKEICSVDLQKNKKTAVFVNLLALIIAAILVVPMAFFVPLDTLFSFEKGMGVYFAKFGILLVGIIVYMVLHELVHGIAMKICGTKKIKYGFTGMYAFAGSEDYYNKKAYLFIALAPVVLWGVVLAIVTPFISYEWFWVVYFIQVNNLSGAAGDLFVTVKFSKLPKDILIKDYGVGMTVYSASCIND